MKLKRFDFQKGKHLFLMYYDKDTELINYLVDIADSDNCVIDLMDVFPLVKKLASLSN